VAKVEVGVYQIKKIEDDHAELELIGSYRNEE